MENILILNISHLILKMKETDACFLCWTWNKIIYAPQWIMVNTGISCQEINNC